MSYGAASDHTAVEPSAIRKLPVQERSRERVERMLLAAKFLIGEHGSDALRMSDVAQHATVSIGSLYQFFPDKTALVGALLERGNAESRRCIEEGFAAVHDEDGLRLAFGSLFDIYYALFLADPALSDIWSAAQADKTLRAIQLAESRENGALLASLLKRIRPDINAQTIDTHALLIMHLGEEAIRLAISADEAEGRLLVETYKQMALRMLV